MFSIVSVRERRAFWATWPSRSLVLATVAVVVTGTLLAQAGLPGLEPLPWWQTLAVLAYAMVSCLGVNDAIKVLLIRRLAASGKTPAQAT